jgi:hypothetical protein
MRWYEKIIEWFVQGVFFWLGVEFAFYLLDWNLKMFQ